MNDLSHAGPPSAAAAFDYAAVEDRYRKRHQLAAELRPGNQQRLMAALAAAGIAEVIVSFDGCGDSGQIESVAARNAAGEVSLPDVGVEIRTILEDSLGTTQTVTGLRELIETLAYDLLEATHDGWEINDGAFGEFTFDVAAGEIRLEYNERFVDSENHQHSW